LLPKLNLGGKTLLPKFDLGSKHIYASLSYVYLSISFKHGIDK
jgi:hypothetical protein